MAIAALVFAGACPLFVAGTHQITTSSLSGERGGRAAAIELQTLPVHRT